jgi:class 3 adenylate cyclase
MATVTTPDLPCHRSIVAVDIENSTARTNSEKAQLRDVMYELVEKALQVGGIAECHRDALIDRGDGILALVHPVDQAPKALLLNSVIPTLSRLLTDHNTHHPDHQFRLRAVVHAGEVHYDSRGCFGEALDITFRLLNAAKVKRKLRQTSTALVLVVSDDIYRSVIRHRYHGIDENAFELLVQVWLAGQRHRGWIHFPDRA